MASTIKLQDVVNYVRSYPELTPILGAGGWSNQPALTLANWVKQFILAPPFAWRWNRTSTSITTVAGTQDYTQAVADFGWMEKASANDGAGAIHELEVAMKLGDEVVQNLPTKISAQTDDNAGNITFRLFPVPDKVYTIKVVYQKQPTRLTLLGDTFSPIPDYLEYLYESGFLAKVLEHTKDDRYAAAMSLFVRQIISANAGLEDSQVNIFLHDQVASIRSQTAPLETSQLGRRARGTF